MKFFCFSTIGPNLRCCLNVFDSDKLGISSTSDIKIKSSKDNGFSSKTPINLVIWKNLISFFVNKLLIFFTKKFGIVYGFVNRG